MFQMWPGGNWSVPNVEAGESGSGHPCDAETALSAAHAAARGQPITTEFQSWVAWQHMAAKSAAVWLRWLVLNHPSWQEFGVVQQTSSFQLELQNITRLLRSISQPWVLSLFVTFASLTQDSLSLAPAAAAQKVVWQCLEDRSGGSPGIWYPQQGVPKLAKTPKWQQKKKAHCSPKF
jgi:hypothetical protein